MKRTLLVFATLLVVAGTMLAQTATQDKGQGRLVLAAADSAQQLTTTQVGCRRVIIQAFPTNTGYVAVGVTKGLVQAAKVDSPLTILSKAHGLDSGQVITIAGVLGNTNANGKWVITKTNADSIKLHSIRGNATYIKDGWWTDIGTATGYQRGDLLAPSGSTTIYINDLSQVWVISSTANNGVTFRWEYAIQ